MNYLILFVIISLIINNTLAFTPGNVNSYKFNNKMYNKYHNKSKQVDFLPVEIAIVAACAGAVFSYVYNNIDSIKEQQRVSTERVVREQDSSLKRVQQEQKDNIERIQRQQQEAIEKGRRAAEEATKRK